MNNYIHHTVSVFCKRSKSLLGVCALLVAAPAAFAFTNTNNLNVSVVVPAAVQLSVTPMNFGTTPTTQSAQATAVITVNMVATQAYQITLDAGRHKATERQMSNGAGSFRSYLLYQDAAHTKLWGDSGFAATYAAGGSVATAGTGTNQTFTIYGTSPAATTPSSTYTDQVTVTVHY